MGNTCVKLCPTRVHSNFPFPIAFGDFLFFFGATALAGSSLFRSTAEWLLLGRQFPLFLGDPLVF